MKEYFQGLFAVGYPTWLRLNYIHKERYNAQGKMVTMHFCQTCECDTECACMYGVNVLPLQVTKALRAGRSTALPYLRPRQ